jgi:hypothetical protein
MSDRVRQIARCMDELEVCRAYMQPHCSQHDREAAFDGYMDWLMELHELVHATE